MKIGSLIIFSSLQLLLLMFVEYSRGVVLQNHKEINSEKDDFIALSSRHNPRGRPSSKSSKSKNQSPDDYHIVYESKPESYNHEYHSKPEFYATSYHNDIPSSKSSRRQDNPSGGRSSSRNRNYDEVDDNYDDFKGPPSHSNSKRNNNNRRYQDDDDRRGRGGGGGGSGRRGGSSRGGEYDYDDKESRPTVDTDEYDNDEDISRGRGFSSDNTYNKETKDDYHKSGKLGDDDFEDGNSNSGGRRYGGGSGRNDRDSKNYSSGNRGGGGNKSSRGSGGRRGYDDDEYDNTRNRYSREYGDGEGDGRSYTSASEY